MSKLSQTPPLKLIQINKTVIQVPTHVNEPLHPKKPTKKSRQELHLLKLLSQLQLLLEKIHRLEVWKLKDSLNDTVLNKLYEQVVQIQMEITTQQQDVLLLDVIKNEKKHLFPRAIKLLFHDEKKELSQEGQGGEEQHQGFDHLNQLYVIACRLYHDLNLSNHKYIAYQLALLYQCINRQSVPFIHYKVRIESKFDDIKSISKKTTDLIQLKQDQIAWLQSLTLDIIMQVVNSFSNMKCADGQLFTLLMHQAIMDSSC